MLILFSYLSCVKQNVICKSWQSQSIDLWLFDYIWLPMFFPIWNQLAVEGIVAEYRHYMTIFLKQTMQDHGDGDIFQSHLSMLKTAKETKHKQTILLPQKTCQHYQNNHCHIYIYLYTHNYTHIYFITYNL